MSAPTTETQSLSFNWDTLSFAIQSQRKQKLNTHSSEKDHLLQIAATLLPEQRRKEHPRGKTNPTQVPLTRIELKMFDRTPYLYV